mmetsp:Transcript_6782/g.27768  ORF Transcript_6782/g.27768 Transcript_6782/m.27768 type:complete len:271 (-) Transcript_6782:798-1610(-)
MPRPAPSKRPLEPSADRSADCVRALRAPRRAREAASWEACVDVSLSDHAAGLLSDAAALAKAATRSAAPTTASAALRCVVPMCSTTHIGRGSSRPLSAAAASTSNPKGPTWMPACSRTYSAAVPFPGTCRRAHLDLARRRLVLMPAPVEASPARSPLSGPAKAEGTAGAPGTLPGADRAASGTCRCPVTDARNPITSSRSPCSAKPSTAACAAGSIACTASAAPSSAVIMASPAPRIASAPHLWLAVTPTMLAPANIVSPAARSQRHQPL